MDSENAAISQPTAIPGLGHAAADAVEGNIKVASSECNQYGRQDGRVQDVEPDVASSKSIKKDENSCLIEYENPSETYTESE